MSQPAWKFTLFFLFLITFVCKYSQRATCPIAALFPHNLHVLCVIACFPVGSIAAVVCAKMQHMGTRRKTATFPFSVPNADLKENLCLPDISLCSLPCRGPLFSVFPLFPIHPFGTIAKPGVFRSCSTPLSCLHVGNREAWTAVVPEMIRHQGRKAPPFEADQDQLPRGWNCCCLQCMRGNL